ncbi:polyneuridine-aldehyde esterase [Phtheirospermum japonicum]|uniref:Polyneuridine-aldehyde esterase n=1 Tax=Phtheirospermum japonicum TaxID=374723 RepID=A0A830B905_9LAMI|nr:polyneuridine-aldehyde esterase [Phtheirospermum japonicum]
MEEGTKQHHFVLIHGACHGAWCWYKVMARLRSEGHRVTALDMAAAGTNPRCVDELSSIYDYCQPLMEFVAGLPVDERVVLVGHSMGGICVSLAMEKWSEKIVLAVFVAAFMPGPNLTVSAAYTEYRRQVGSYMDSQYSFSNGHDKPPTSFLFGPEFMASHLYQLSPPEDLTLATLLARPIGLLGESDSLKEGSLTKDNFGSVRRGYVLCDQDNVLKLGFQEWMIEHNPTDEVKIINGADHMVMFSKSQELCVCLQHLADVYC